MLSRQSVRLARTAPVNSKAMLSPRFMGNRPGERDIAGNPYKSDQAGDPLHQGFKQSKEAAAHPEDTTPLDAVGARRNPRNKPDRGDVSGNPEGVGFVDQVGSQTASADHLAGKASGNGKTESFEGFSGQENITPPSFADAVKKKLGFKTTAGEDKQNRGGGEGVTGTGKPRFDTAKRTFSTSVVARTPAANGTNSRQAPDSSRQPKEATNAEQNPHLKHKPSTASDSGGKGNAAEQPTLPSHKVNSKQSSHSEQFRAFSTSARVSKEEPKHTAESYFKDVDSSPAKSSTYQVDGSATGPDVQRPNESLSGQYSQSGAGDKEYETIDRKHPYDVPPSAGPGNDQKLRYGGKPNSVESEDQISQPGEGAEGENKGGRKPEGR